MGRVVGAEPLDRRSISACECSPWPTGFLQALPSVADTAARRSLYLMMQGKQPIKSGTNDEIPRV